MVQGWCRQATSHQLSQSRPRSMSPYGVTRLQWVNSYGTFRQQWWLPDQLGLWPLMDWNISHSPKPQRIARFQFECDKEPVRSCPVTVQFKSPPKICVISFVSNIPAFLSCSGSKKYTKSPCWLKNSPVKDDPPRYLAFNTTSTPWLRGRGKKKESSLDEEFLVVVTAENCSLFHLLVGNETTVPKPCDKSITLGVAPRLGNVNPRKISSVKLTANSATRKRRIWLKKRGVANSSFDYSEQHGMSYLVVFNMLLGLTTLNTRKLSVTGPLWGESIGDMCTPPPPPPPFQTVTTHASLVRNRLQPCVC